MPFLQIAFSLMLVFFAGASKAGTEDEVKALFAKFVAAQNAHDLKAVAETLQDSPQFLWITRGTPVWGREAALNRFEALYQGTWSLDPKTDELRVIEVRPDVVHLFVPITFTISPAPQLVPLSSDMFHDESARYDRVGFVRGVPVLRNVEMVRNADHELCCA